MNRRHVLLPLLAIASLLGGCGYGWEDTPRTYPPSGAQASQGQVVPGKTVLGAGEYLVQPGDTLYAIGFRNQIDWKDLAAWNHIDGDYVIRPGQVLRLTPTETSDSIQTRPLGTAPKPVPPPSSLPAPVAIPADAPTAVVSPATAPVVAPALPATPAKPGPVAAVPAAAGSAVRWAWPNRGKLIRGYNLAAGSKGIDISGELGQPVVAAAAGKVVYSGSALKGYGELVIVKHDDTYLSAYGYNRVRLVKEGDSVQAGQTLAELGMGPEQKPVLHFEIREHGKPVDPLKFLPAP